MARIANQDCVPRIIPHALEKGNRELRGPCDRCDRGEHDTALAVSIDADGAGATWDCHRCGWVGGFRHRRLTPKQRSDGSTAAGNGTISDELAHRYSSDTHKAARDTRNLALAKRLLARSVPAKGTLVEEYLRCRGLVLPDGTPLEYLPDNWHWPTRTKLGCMLAPIVNIRSNELIGLHQTFLSADGLKYPDHPRLYLGKKSGGVVKLIDDAEITMGLALSEGLENALVAIAASYPCWAALDAGNLVKFPVLAGVEALTVFADADPVGLEAAEKTVARWRAAGREAVVAAPDRADSDWNDHLLELRERAHVRTA